MGYREVISKEGRRRREEQRAVARAEAEAADSAKLEELAKKYLEQRKEHQKPALDVLKYYAGRLILVTNPHNEETSRSRYHRPIAEALQTTVPRASAFGFSLHKLTGPYSGKDIHVGGRMIAEELAGLTDAEVDPNMPSRINRGEITAASLLSALGIDGLNLDYANARYGDTFVLDEVDGDYNLRWDKIFQSPISSDGSHHLL